MVFLKYPIVILSNNLREMGNMQINKNIKLRFSLFLIILGIGIVSACSKSNEVSDAFENFDRKSMLTNLGTKVIVPLFEQFYQKTSTLEQTLTAYTADPQSEEKLKAAQQAWIAAAIAWKEASVFKQGPIEDKFLLSNVDFSTNGVYLNISLLEKTIIEATSIDNAFIESKGATVKGIHAVEYLIFDKSQNNSNIISLLTGANSTKRRSYLLALSTNLKNQGKVIIDEWNSSYLSTFQNADGRDINSSLGKLSNKLIEQIYTIRDERIGLPLGKRNNGTVQPELVESYLSGVSVTLAINELKGIEDAFLGRTPAGVNGVGIDDLLDKLGAKSGEELLSSKIKNQFTSVYAKLNAIQNPLSLAVINSKTDVQTAYDEIKKLQVLMEVDMINNLGVLLTFSDNDGD